MAKATTAPPAGGGGKYMLNSPREMLHASVTTALYAAKSSAVNVPPERKQRLQLRRDPEHSADQSIIRVSIQALIPVSCMSWIKSFAIVP